MSKTIDGLSNFFIDKVVPITSMITISAVILAIPTLIYCGVTEEKIQLIAREWECTEKSTKTTYVMVGNILTPVVRSSCINWRKR